MSSDDRLGAGLQHRKGVTKRAAVAGEFEPPQGSGVASHARPSCNRAGRSGAVGLAVDAVEDGATAEENARIKARAYFDAAGIPTFSLDAALRIDGLPPDQQPDIRVRRIRRAGEHATDTEMVSHYADLLGGLGGQATGEWTLGIALADTTGQVRSAQRVHRSRFVAKPSPELVPGAALQSLQVNPATGRYFSEMTPAEHAARLRERARWIVGFVVRHLPGVASVAR